MNIPVVGRRVRLLVPFTRLSHLFRVAVLVGTGLACSTGLQAGPKVGVLLKGKSPFWSSMEKGAMDAGAKLGAEVVVKAPNAEADVAVQVQLLNAMATQGFAAIVIVPANKDALAAPVAALEAKGVKIVVLESPLSGSGSRVFVGTDHDQAGAAAGKLLATLVGDADEVSFLNHSQTNSSTLAREKSALAKFREARAKNVVHSDIYASTEAGTEPEKARLLLEKHPATKAIFVSSTGGTLAMLKVLQQQKKAGAVKLVGFGFDLNSDVASALADGSMHGWIAWQPRELGRRGVETAVALVKGETVPAVVNTDFIVITPENVKQANVQSLLGQ